MEGTAASPPESLERWCAPLQLACRLEAEAGFGDLQGRRDRFSGFLATSLAAPPEGLEPGERRQIAAFARDVAGYGALAPSARQSLVRRLRQALRSGEFLRRPVLNGH